MLPRVAFTAILSGSLLVGLAGPTLIWRSREALEEYRRSVSTPTGIAMFQSVGAEPMVSVWSVAHAHVQE